MKKVLSLTLALALYLGLTAPAMAAGRFTDVASNAYYANAVDWAVSKGITSGTSDTTFSPDKTCTTAQIITFLWRANGSPDPGIESMFSGILSGDYYYKAALWAWENGLIVGDTFYPDRPCTRSATVTYLWKLAGSPAASGGAFSDVPANADYAQAVAWAVENSITSGTSDTTFSPDSICTRGQIALFLYRALEPNAQPVPTAPDPQTPEQPEQPAFTPVPMKDLANRKSLQRKATDDQLAQAYEEAVKLVTPYAGLSLEDQLMGVAAALRQRFDIGMSYSMTSSHYNDPYGYFIEGSASCAGCTRATGLCLNILGIPYEHVNENEYSHQWCRVNVNGTYWICDAYGLYCGPEPAPYTHPYFQ